MPASSLADRLDNHSVVICAGPGGVGKTSVTAALSVAAARRGRRVLALTVDPSLRLAESLGVATDTDERQPIDERRSRELGIPDGALSVMMLDPARTWNELVKRTAPDREAERRILEHPLYRVLVEYLAGAHEYMAMEKLLSVMDAGGQDLIILDTPPSRHALDFLQAPERLVDAVDGPVMKGLAHAVEGGGRFSLRLVSRSILLVVRSLGRLMGASMLEQLAELISELDRVFGGFRKRAQRIAAAFGEPHFGYVLVSRPSASAVAETLHFERALKERGLAGDAIVLNCVHPPLPEQADRALAALHTELDAGLLAHVERALSEHRLAVDAQRATLRPLLAESRAAGRQLVALPAIPSGVLGTRELGIMAEHLKGDRELSLLDPPERP